MSKLSTYLHEDDIADIVHICAEEIRGFLDHLVAPREDSPYRSIDSYAKQWEDAKKEFHSALKDFCDHPQRYSDEVLMYNGANIEEAFHFPVRIEVRRTPDVPGASQIAAKGIYGDFRREVLKKLSQLKSRHGYKFDARLAGRSSFEVNVQQVNKALPLKYIKNEIDDILYRMRYTPGQCIDASATKTLIAADGDSTTYGPPTESKLPILKNSPAYKSLIEYLSIGGVYMLISGNDLSRTLARVIDSIPLELKNRLIVAANGGADLAICNSDGRFHPLEEYRAFALQYAIKKNSPSIDMIFIGDNPSADGNDYFAFEEMGGAHGVLVSEEKPADLKMNNLIYIGGLERGTDAVLKKTIEYAKKNKRKPIFNNAEKWLGGQ